MNNAFSIGSGKTPSQNGVGSSNLTIDIKISPKHVEANSLYAILPQHYAQLVGGPDNKALVASRQRLGQTAGGNAWPWAVLQEKVTELFGKGKLRHVATLEEALAEINQVEKYWNAAILANA
ncbi:hypothetical protein GCM10027594_10970 [Hymenobacter agri]